MWQLVSAWCHENEKQHNLAVTRDVHCMSLYAQNACPALRTFAMALLSFGAYMHGILSIPSLCVGPGVFVRAVKYRCFSQI